MQQENDDDAMKVNRPDTRRYEAQDDDGHLKGSRQAGSSQENFRKEREKDDKDQSELNKLDARDTVDGDEIL